MARKESRAGGINLVEVCDKLVADGVAARVYGGAIRMNHRIDWSSEEAMRIEKAYAQDFDRRWEENRRRKREALKKLYREHPEGFHIDF